MDINDLHPPDDYSHRFFIWHEWIQANGPLTAQNVFEYFASSMFYDKQSNNQVLRMQTAFTGVPMVNEAEELKRFVGIEFALVHAQPQPASFFIIQKRERISPEEVKPLAAYFIMNNRIYQSPDIYTILSNRLLTSLCSLQASLDVLRKHRPDFTPRTGFVWPITDPSIPDVNNKKRVTADESIDADTDEVMTITKPKPSEKKQQNYALLMNAMRATAMHSVQSTSAFSGLAVAEPSSAETPAPNQRSSVTPAPQPQEPRTSAASAPSSQPQTAVKAPAGAGKKKRKRTSIVAPSGP
ncbi:MED6-domain-containing protein [Pluteus cervinus]|uniref:MED6-domain-containing protein n=1 Tax=Pluteus cervinus TaxID=181527 RepID=A0ACD3BFK0_9AGAR|nr:MED6-domain-containing protein [Pluteus cervinus]